MTAEDFLKKQGIHPSEPIYRYGDDDIITLEQILEDYHQAKLKLLGIADSVEQSERYHCELFDFGRCEKPCDKQCYSCYWMESKKQ